jgi:hypothetical protein
MTPEDIQRALKSNDGKRVRVTYCDGTTEVVDVAWVDDEGFGGSGPHGVEPAAYWTRFDSIAHVEPLG